jgi:hypothetical protein
MYAPAYAPFTPAYRPAYALAPYGYPAVGAATDPNAPPQSFWDKTKAKASEIWNGSTIPSVPNKYLITGAALVGGIWIAHAKRWI